MPPNENAVAAARDFFPSIHEKMCLLTNQNARGGLEVCLTSRVFLFYDRKKPTSVLPITWQLEKAKPRTTSRTSTAKRPCGQRRSQRFFPLLSYSHRAGQGSKKIDSTQRDRTNTRQRLSTRHSSAKDLPGLVWFFLFFLASDRDSLVWCGVVGRPSHPPALLLVCSVRITRGSEYPRTNAYWVMS